MRGDPRDENGEGLEDLGRLEQMLVWALRTIAIGHGDCPALRQTFERACGEMGERALQAYIILIKYVGIAGRRRLQVQIPGSRYVSADEARFLGVLAVAQRTLHGHDEAQLKARLNRLLGDEARPVFLAAAQVVAQALNLGGHVLACGEDNRDESGFQCEPQRRQALCGVPRTYH